LHKGGERIRSAGKCLDDLADLLLNSKKHKSGDQSFRKEVKPKAKVIRSASGVKKMKGRFDLAKYMKMGCRNTNKK